MGMSRAGVFYVVLIRALIIGLLAALLSLALGFGFAWLLGPGPRELGWWIPWRAVSVVFLEIDLITVVVGALACAGVGALVPAWRAGTIDPFDAIMEGRLH
jgi:ABC-type antimicrobial peptide transport system permease subunit